MAIIYDANVQYLHGRHIPLFVVGAGLLLLSVPYTILLLTSEVLRASANTHVLRWMNSPRVTYFTDAYNAPFKRGHAYWTGLLLIARIVLLFISGLNDPNVNLLTTVLITITLAILEWVVRGPYNCLWLNILEAMSVLNLSILTAVTFYLTRNHATVTLAHVHDHNQTLLSNISVGVCILLVAVLLIYHIHLQVKGSILWKKLKTQCFHKGRPDSLVLSHQSVNHTVLSQEVITSPAQSLQLYRTSMSSNISPLIMDSARQTCLTMQ